jgi:hypothetical protein
VAAMARGAVVKEEEARVAVPCRVDKEAARAMGVVVMVMVAAAMAMAMAVAATVTAVAVRAAVKEAAARAVVGWDTTTPTVEAARAEGRAAVKEEAARAAAARAAGATTRPGGSAYTVLRFGPPTKSWKHARA